MSRVGSIGEVAPAVDYPTLVAVDGLRYAIPASIAFGIFWVWKWAALAHRRIQPRRPSRRALTREVRFSILTTLIFAGVGWCIWQLVDQGVVELYADVDRYGWPYWFASIAIAIVLHDTYFYWTHRAMHHPRLFKLFHRVHHLSTSPSPLAAYAFAPAEAVVEALAVPAVLLVMPLHRLALFAWLFYMIVKNVIGHLGIELYPRWFPRARLTRHFTTSTHHNLHHRDFVGNYGLYFTWWDRMMGTEHRDYHATFERVTR